MIETMLNGSSDRSARTESAIRTRFRLHIAMIPRTASPRGSSLTDPLFALIRACSVPLSA